MKSNLLQALPWLTGTHAVISFLTPLIGGVVIILTFVSVGGGSYAAAPQVGVYVGSGDGAVYRLEAQNGKFLWRFQTQGRTIPAPVTVAAGRVYFGSTDGKVYALNAANGTTHWQFQTGASVISSPIVNGGVVYVGSSDGNVYALRAADGTKIWNYFAGQSGENVSVGTVAVDQGVVYGSSSDETSHSYLFALDAGTGSELWRTRVNDQIFTNPQVVNDIIYIASSAIAQQGGQVNTDSFVYAFNAKDGSLKWRSLTVKDVILAAPTVVDGVVYFGSRDTNVYALNAHGGMLLWQRAVGRAVNVSPQVVDGVVYVGETSGMISGNMILALNAIDGSLRWQHPIMNYAGANLVVSGNVLYVGSLDSVVYALKAADGTQVWSHRDTAPFSNEPLTVA